MVGILLGDGHIQQRTSTSNSKFMYTQTYKHLEYFDLIFNMFYKYCTINYLPKIKSVTNQNNIYNYKSFATIALPCFNYYRNIFYNENGIKIIPKEIENLLTDISLTYWIMDDGSKHGKGLHLNTYGFNNQCIERLILVLRNKFKLECSIHKKNEQSRIYIKEKSMNKVKSITIPHMHTSMYYKLGIKYKSI